MTHTTYSIADIKIAPQRQRQHFDPQALAELMTSIDEVGLLHAPAVFVNSDGVPELVAGERRIRTIKDMFALGMSFTYDSVTYDADKGIIPVTTLQVNSKLAAEEAEWAENAARADLTWQEKAAATERLQNLREKRSAVVNMQSKGLVKTEAEAEKILTPALIKANSTHTISDTAQELHGRSDGAYRDTVRKELIVAKNLNNPALKNAKSVDEAFKILKKEEVRQQQIALAVSVGQTFTADSHRIINVDCLKWMADSTNHNYFDIILTDPPYGMGADEFGDAGGKLSGIEHRYDDSPEAWAALMQPWADLSFKVAKDQAHAYVFCDIDNFHQLKVWMQTAGWYVFRTPFIIHKINSGRVPLPDRGPRRQWEMALYAIKGKKPVNHIYADVVSATADENTTHGAQKPVAVYQNLLQRSFHPGAKILDSFAGSGVLLPAAHAYKCEATLLELNPQSYGICLSRAKALKASDTSSMDEISALL